MSAEVWCKNLRETAHVLGKHPKDCFHCEAFALGLAQQDAEVARLREGIEMVDDDWTANGIRNHLRELLDGSGRVYAAARALAATGAKPTQHTCDGDASLAAGTNCPACNEPRPVASPRTSPRAELDEAERMHDAITSQHVNYAEFAEWLRSRDEAASAETVRAVCEALKGYADDENTDLYLLKHERGVLGYVDAMMVVDWLESGAWKKGGAVR